MSSVKPPNFRLRQKVEPSLEAKQSNNLNTRISTNAITIDRKREDEFAKQFDFSDLAEIQMALAKDVWLAEREWFSVGFSRHRIAEHGQIIPPQKSYIQSYIENFMVRMTILLTTEF